MEHQNREAPPGQVEKPGLPGERQTSTSHDSGPAPPGGMVMIRLPAKSKRSGPEDPDDLRYPEVPAAKKALQTLAQKLGLTDNAGPDPWLLTAQEEQAAIDNEITRRRMHLAWKMGDLGYTEEAILAKIAGIDWGAEFDRQEVLQQCNSNKNHEVWHRQEQDRHRQDEAKKRQALQARYTAKFFFNMMQWACQQEHLKKLEMFDWQKHLITAICMFMSRDQRFETELGYSFSKGLKIRGVSGIGKTFLIKLIAANEFQPVKIVSIFDMLEMAANHGMQEIPIPGNGILYLDDVGSEEDPVVRHYGTKINVYKQFLELYYLRNSAYNRLIISTNSSNKEIEDLYGFRVRSRHREMFNDIDVKSDDGVDLRY